MTREQQTVALLRSWLDYFPWPETWTGELQRRAGNRGPAPFRRVQCGECEGRGKTRSGWMCSTCKGKGSYHIDDYTLEPVDTAATPFAELLARFVNCDVCGGWGRVSADSNARPDKNVHPICDRCDGIGKVAAPFGGVCRPFRSEDARELIGDRRLDAMQREHEQRDTHLAYVELDRLLALLKREDRNAHFMLCWIYILGGQTVESLPASGLVVLARGVAWIAERLPEGLQLPGEVYAAEVARETSLALLKGKGVGKVALARRDEEIRKRYATGNYTLEQLASHFKLDKSRVSRIVRKVA